MDVRGFLEWLESFRLSQAIAQGDPWPHLFPAIETVHVLALTLTVGSIVMVDFRLLGWRSRESGVTRLTSEVLPWTWLGFCIAAVAGVLLFMSKAESYYDNLQFRLKFMCMFLIFINMLVFHRGVYRRAADWDTVLPPPLAARIAGGVSLSLWIAVVFFGRWIGFTGMSGGG